MEIPPYVLQNIGPLGPLPKKDVIKREEYQESSLCLGTFYGHGENRHVMIHCKTSNEGLQYRRGWVGAFNPHYPNTLTKMRVSTLFGRIGGRTN